MVRSTMIRVHVKARDNSAIGQPQCRNVTHIYICKSPVLIGGGRTRVSQDLCLCRRKCGNFAFSDVTGSAAGCTSRRFATRCRRRGLNSISVNLYW